MNSRRLLLCFVGVLTVTTYLGFGRTLGSLFYHQLLPESFSTFFQWFHLWCSHVSIAGWLSLPIIYFGRNKAKWRWWELNAYVTPSIIWWLMVLYCPAAKSLGNFGEVFFISIEIVAICCLRVLIGSNIHVSIMRIVAQFLLCFMAVLTFLLTPMLPE
jgi:hypothetical protein